MARKPATPKSTAVSTSERPKRVIPKKPETSTSSQAPKKRSVAKSSSSSRKKTTSTTSKRSTSKKNTSKPTYERMVIKALRELGSRTAHSSSAVAKYVFANYPVPEDTHKRFVRLALKKAHDEGLVVQHRASYRVSAAASAKENADKSRKAAAKRKRSSSSSDDGRPKKRTTRTSRKAGTMERERSTPATDSASSTSTSTRSSSRSKATTDSSKKASKSKSVKADKPTKKARNTNSSKSESEQSSESISVTKPNGLKGDHMWQYQDGTWKNYDVEAANTVEEVYQGYLANRGDTDVRAVKSGQWEYMVDFMAMKQTNIQHDNHTVRNIRRIPVS